MELPSSQHPSPAGAVPAPAPHRRSRAGPVLRTLGAALAATCVVLAASLTPAAHAAGPPAGTGQLVPVTSLGGQGSFAAAMNDRGDIVGASVDTRGEHRAVVWWQGRRSPTDLGVDGAWPVAVSGQGHIVGYAGGGLFLWRDGSVDRLRPRPGMSLEPVGINDDDQVAGTATGRDGATRAFRWHRGHLTMLPTPRGATSRTVGLNDRGWIIGVVTRTGTERAALWRDGRLVELGTLGGAGSIPARINDRGQVSGSSAVTGSSADHPFLWQDGVMNDLLAGTGATAGQVADLNDAGTMTGRASFGDHDSRPVLRRDGRMTVIGLPGHVGGGSHLNDRGDVTGVTWPDPQARGVPFRWRDGRTTLYPEPAADIAVTVVGIDRDGVVAVDQETSSSGNLVLRST